MNKGMYSSIHAAGHAFITATAVMICGSLVDIRAADAQQLIASTERRGPMSAVAFSPDGDRIASSSVDGNVYVWEAGSGRMVATLRGHDNEVFDVAYSPKGGVLASAAYDGRVLLWDATSGQRIGRWRAEPWPIPIAFSPDGRYLLVGGVDGEIQMIDLESEETTTYATQHRSISALAYGPSGERAAGAFGVITIFDPLTGTVRDRVPGHAHITLSLAFTPDGSRLVSASMDATIRVWNLADDELTRTIEARSALPFIAISPDGTRLAAGGADFKVHLWPLSSGNEAATILGSHEQSITGLDFSPDGSRLATSSLDGTVKIWRVPDAGAIE